MKPKALLLWMVIFLLYGGMVYAAEEKPASDEANNPDTKSEGIKVAQADTSTAATAEQTPAVSEEGEKPEEEENKWWSLTFGYDLSHNLARERPTLTNAFYIDPSFVAPYKINVGVHVGFSVATDYATGEIGERDVTVNTVDMDPLSISVSRKFSIDPDITGFSITPSLGALIPYTSRFSGQVNKWYFALKPAVSLGVSKWGLSLSNKTAVQKNWHGEEYRYINSTSTGTATPSPLNEWSVSNSTSLRYSFWKMNIGAGFTWSRSFRYNNSATEQASNSLSYSADAGIDVYEGLSAALGISTVGPERRNGGFKSDYTVPFDPLYTTVFFSLSYTL